MNVGLIFLVGMLVFSMVSCREKPEEVEISETRELTSLDEEPAVNATSSEQFLRPEVAAQIGGFASPIKNKGDEASKWAYQLPAADWKELPSRVFREVNLTFGNGEQMGEIYLSVVGGGVEGNVNRWYGQFGNPVKPLAELGRLDFLGKKAYLVEAVGRYEAGRGKPGKDGQALLGAVVESEGRLVTVKMIGPEKEVHTRREQFLKFVASLKRK